MINISYNEKTKQLNSKILKFSTYLKFQNDEKSYAEEPLPLLSTTDNIFDKFVKWFDVVCKNYYLAKKSKIFYVDYFEDFNVNELFDMFNFAIANQIKLLSYTVAKIIGSRVDTYEFSGKWWYVDIDEKFEMIGDRLIKQIYNLPFMTKSVLDEVKDFNDRYCKTNDFDYVCSKEHKIPQKDLLKLYKLWADAENKLFTNPNFIMMMDKCSELIYLEFTDDDTVNSEEVEDFSYDDEYLSIKFRGHAQTRKTKFTFKQFIDIINDEYRIDVEYKWLFTDKFDKATAKDCYRDIDHIKSLTFSKNENSDDDSEQSENNTENSTEQSEQSENNTENSTEQSERSDDDSSDDELDFE